MSVGKKILFVSGWLALGTVLYAHTWSNHLDNFPQLPEQVGLWIAKVTGMSQSDDAELLTAYYVFIVSFVMVCLVTAVVALTVRLICNRRKSAAS